MGRGMEWKAIRRGESNEGIRGAYSKPQETEDVSELLEADSEEIKKVISGIDTSMDEEPEELGDNIPSPEGRHSDFWDKLSSSIKSQEEQDEYFFEDVEDEEKRKFMQNMKKRMNGEKVQEEDPKKKFLEDIRRQMNGEAR